MKLWKIIPLTNVDKSVILELSNFGFVLVWRQDNVEVYKYDRNPR